MIQVGDRVQARDDRWSHGTVIRILDGGWVEVRWIEVTITSEHTDDLHQMTGLP